MLRIPLRLYVALVTVLAAAVVLALIGVAIPAVNVAVGPIVLQVTPRAYLGRVSATINPLVNAASLLGLLLGGFLYGTVFRDFEAEVAGVRFGPLDTIFAGVGIACLLGAAYARANLRGEGVDEGAA